MNTLVFIYNNLDRASVWMLTAYAMEYFIGSGGVETLMVLTTIHMLKNHLASKLNITKLYDINPWLYLMDAVVIVSLMFIMYQHTSNLKPFVAIWIASLIVTMRTVVIGVAILQLVAVPRPPKG